MLDTEIFVKTDAGRDEIRSRTLGLPMSVRAILLMIDGQRTVSAMRALIAGSKAPADVLDSLVSQGLIERRGGAVTGDTPPASPPPPAPAPAPASTPVPSSPRAAEDAVATTRPTLAPAPAPAPAEPLLDLVLPTIHAPLPADEAPVVPPAAAVAPKNEYEHLYAMMNEIVRDFLAPHRRYFFQLKIERCGTAEDLLELLHDLQTALAKSRGEAFASEVIARLRSAAA